MFEKLEEYEDEITLLILGPINFVMFSWVGFFFNETFQKFNSYKSQVCNVTLKLSFNL